MPDWSTKCVTKAAKPSPSSFFNNLSLEGNDVAYGSINQVVLVSTKPNDKEIVAFTLKGKVQVFQVKLAKLLDKTYCIASTSKGVQIWNAKGTTCIYDFDVSSEVDSEKPELLLYCRGISTNKESGHIYVGCSHGFILVFQMTEGEKVALKCKLRGHTSAVNAIISNLDYVVSGDNDGGIIGWDIDSKYDVAYRVKSLNDQDEQYAITSICCPNNGGFLTGDVAGKLRLYRIRSGKIAACVCAHSRAITAMDVLNNKYVVSVGDDTYINVWKIPNLKDTETKISLLYSTPSSDQLLTGVQFTDEGHIVSVAYDDDTISVWGEESGIISK